MPQRTGTFGSGPLDLDLTIWTYPDLDLIWCVGFGSGGSDLFSWRAAAHVAGIGVPRRGFAGVGGTPGVKTERGWVGDAPHAMRDPLDQDLRAQDEGVRRSNLGRWF